MNTAVAIAVAGLASSASLAQLDAQQARFLDLANAQVRQTAQPVSTAEPAPHRGFIISTQDGRNTMRIDGLMQFRYIATFDAQQEGESDDFASGFQHQRTRFGVGGKLGDAGFGYRAFVQINSDGSFSLVDAFLTRELAEGWTLRFGQFMLPFDRERFGTSPVNVLAVDRSVVDSVFALDRSQGVMLTYVAERFRVSGALSDGRRATNSRYNSANSADYALSARAEGRFGDAPWSQFNTMTGYRGDQFGMLLGAGFHFQEDGNIPVPVGDDSAGRFYGYTADIGFEGDGWSALAAFQGRTIDASGGSVTDLGFVVQGGVAISDHADVFARYAMLFPDNDRAGGSDDFSAITVGMNYYFVPRSQAVRLTGEVVYYPETRDDSASIVNTSDGLALLRDDSGGQVSVVLQMQFQF
ncbi:MAG: hypothetical protein EA378_07345 [Phycisphaerales bacterium]|nr:MAG: hypothetical protein EA378_07345 [Phycisphaerales bacterium]